MPYGMIDTKVFDSTVILHGFETVYVFMSMIALANNEHVCDFGRHALAGRIGVTLDQLEDSLEKLSRTDPDSNSQDFDGRRIVALKEIDEIESNRGWLMVNRERYINEIKRENRKKQVKEAVSKFRQKKEGQAGSSEKVDPKENLSENNDVIIKKAHVDVDVDQDVENNKAKATAFGLFWEAFPRKVKKKRAREVWMAKKLDCAINELLSDVANRLANHAPWKNGYIPHPTTYLNGELWNDEIEKEDLVQVKKGNGKHLVPSYKDGSALEAYGKSIDKLPKRTESYYQYWQRLCVHAEQEGAHET
tara:strand:+ start:3763 stop:4677 length:915 start_codon:yes stop_codon:yes gene_type:complete